MNKDQEIIKEKMNLLKGIFTKPTPELFKKIFTADCDYITFMGQHLKGINENFDVHQNLTNNWFFKQAELVIVDLQIKILNEHTATVISKGAIKLRWQKKINLSRLSINTNVFIKQNDDWKLASFQNTRIKNANFLMRLFSR